MKDFPDFMKSPANRIDKSSQYTDEIEGYVFDGKDGSQMAIWTCHQDRSSKVHVHEYDEYMVVAHGEYTIEMNGRSERFLPGQECFIPKGTQHSGRALAGTRTIHCFGGKRVQN